MEPFAVFESNQKPIGTQYTGTVALLAIAFIFSPAAALVSRPVGYLSVLMAATASVVCVVLARINWKRNSQLTMPSLETPRREGEMSPRGSGQV
jgi:hypothetical protein